MNSPFPSPLSPQPVPYVDLAIRVGTPMNAHDQLVPYAPPQRRGNSVHSRQITPPDPVTAVPLRSMTIEETAEDREIYVIAVCRETDRRAGDELIIELRDAHAPK